MVGHQSTMRADIAYKPKSKGSSEDVATILTAVVDQILDANDYHDKVEPLVFQDGVIEDRGFIDVRMSFDDNFQGEVTLKSLDPRSVVIDPDARDYDPATWTEVFIDNWLSPDDIEAMYGKDKRTQVEAICVTPLSTFGTKSVRYDTFGDNATVIAETVDEARIKSVRVIERQYKRYTMVREFVDLSTGEMRRVPDHWDEGRITAVSQQYGLPIRKRFTSRIRWTVTADHIVLHDDWSPYDTFTVVPYFPVFRRGRPSGLVRHLLDPQDQLNKIESQVLHVINTTANSGWMVEEGSLRNT